jgi:hypothetical protein
MKIKVIKLLNTRIGGPRTAFPKGVTRNVGEEIEVMHKVKGESLDGNDDWYYDGDDKYYWSGGVEIINN